MESSFLIGNNPIANDIENAMSIDALVHFLLLNASHAVIFQKINAHKYHIVNGGVISSFKDGCPNVAQLIH